MRLHCPPNGVRVKYLALKQAISVSLADNLQEAYFVDRPNRFLVHCQLKKNDTGAGNNKEGEIVSAHLADPGRLKELLFTGNRLWLRPANNSQRKTAWSAVLCEAPGGDGLVSLDSTLPNRLIGKALAADAMEEFADWSFVRSEYKMGRSRWDFLLTDVEERHLVLEVKSVTLVKDGVGFFPDAISARGAKHARELAELVRERGWEAAILFVAQREKVRLIKAAAELDPNFADALEEAKAAGVQVLGRKCHITIQKVTLGESVPVG